MPLSMTPQASGGPRRRAVLTGGLAVPLAALAGCSGGAAHGAPADPTAELSGRAARDSTALLARYDATAAAHPALADRLRPLRAQVALHLAAFTPPGGSPGPAPGVPADQNAALATLADAERRIADTRTAALQDAPPELARLLASVAAAGACHAALLQGGGAE